MIPASGLQKLQHCHMERKMGTWHEHLMAAEEHIQRVAKVVPRLVGIVENSLRALDFQNSCLFVNCIGNA